MWSATALVALLGLCAELGEYLAGAPEPVVEIFSLSYEANLPTWYASVLLFSCAAALFAIAREASRERAWWWLLAGGFLTMSLDEAIEIHEHASFFDTGGVLYFSWVIPAAVLVSVLGLVFVPFLRRLRRESRRAFVMAGAIYVAGAVGAELPLGWWTERSGDHNLVYGLIDWVEESLELSGASLFLLALLDHRRDAREVPA